MSNAGQRIIQGMTEAVAIAKGDQPAACIYVQGHPYVPEERLHELKRQLADMRSALEQVPPHLKELRDHKRQNCQRVQSIDHSIERVSAALDRAPQPGGTRHDRH